VIVICVPTAADIGTIFSIRGLAVVVVPGVDGLGAGWGLVEPVVGGAVGVVVAVEVAVEVELVATTVEPPLFSEK
jgi:hypothetical protein